MGHGVGLCQIGGSSNGRKGFKYDSILLHYYINATLRNITKHEKQYNE